jgi:hypothetical protein
MTTHPDRHKYSYTRFLRDVMPVLETKERSGMSPYYFVFVHKGRRDFLDLWGPTNKVIESLRAVAAESGIPVEELFTHVRLYRRSTNAHTNFIDPVLIAEDYRNVAGNFNYAGKMGNVHRLMAFDTLQDERQASGLTALPTNITRGLLPKYLTKRRRSTRRRVGGARKTRRGGRRVGKN